MKRQGLTRYLDQLLESVRFHDYCPNGLQVEGCNEVRHIVAGVTASQALLDVAVARGADTLLVHHGWLWRGEDRRITGVRKTRLRSLLENDINLIGYHLPLDSHAELGNNAQLARQFGWQVEGRFADQELGWYGRIAEPVSLTELTQTIATTLQREAQVIGDPERELTRIAWCSGSAQGFFEEAVALGVDAYLSGEISEANVHLARESGVAYIAAGHHATERFGVRALAAHLAQHFGIHCEFVDIDNPV